ncbi:MAG: dihydrolipoyl dehydrogenase [Puniceicoccaceae bacterium]
MADQTEYDLIVIGGGPAGYAGAIKAGQLGKRVACIEVERAGGTCLNWGCIPSKALLKSAELHQKMLHAEEFGFSVGDISFDFSKIIRRSRDVSDRMAGGIEFLFRKNKVDYIIGSGQVKAPGVVTLTSGERKGENLKTKNILVATGCKARTLPNLQVDGVRVMTSREALVLEKQPESVVIMGAGAIGAEFAYFLNALGTKVTLVEMLPAILPVEDSEISAALEKSFKKQGISCHTGTKVENIKVLDNGVRLDLNKDGKIQSIEVQSLLLAIGVVANIEGVFSSDLKPELNRDYLVVDETYQTSIPGIYAAGDIIGPPWLAHVATFEAVQAVGGIFTDTVPAKVRHFPGCTYCIPQVASIGATERKLKEDKVAYKVGKFPFTASGKAVASNLSEGFVKLIVSEEHGEILGAHIIGSEATELIAEYALAIELEATAEEIHHTIHAHPTMTEALMEAAASVYGEAIHI